MNVEIKSDAINEIADLLDSGMKCFYHIPTGEVESHPDDSQDYVDLDEEIWQEVIDKVKSDYKNYIKFEKMDSRESFQIMENFVETIADKNIQQRFEDAIRFRKPFQNFKQMLENFPDLREEWFKFKDDYYRNYVVEQLDIYNQLQSDEE
jgi:signal transduction protein with GAF and PtsI domain